ncbi:MAG: DNA polymerase I [Candidatus Omnitrophica bacterium]|nr:DNA polymerase I [Candidatus Omnitrophota bacterium]
MSKKTLYLVDGTSLCYRSFFALKLSTSTGFPSGAVYGVYLTLKKIISKYNPSYMGICFDVSRKTFRHKKFKEYKINRPALPEDLKVQIPLIKKLVSSLGIKIIEKEGFEADDVIASLCDKAVKNGLTVVIASSDKDLCQLIDSDKVSVYNYNKDKFIDKDDFFKEYGFEPKFMIDYLSLAGDSTDNIPGAKGIGKVGAAKLIKEFGSLENISKNLNKLPQKARDILTKNKEMISLSRELVELSLPDVGLKCRDLKVGEPDSKGLYEMFRELGFKAFLKNIPAPSLNLGLKVKAGIPKELLERLAKETLALFIKGEECFLFDGDKKDIYKVPIPAVKEILEDEKIKKISYGFKSQLSQVRDIEIKGLWFDVKIAAYLLDSALPDYTLSTLVSHYLAEHFSRIPPEYIPYFVFQLYRLLSVKLKEENLDKLFFDIEMPLVTILGKMQIQGVKVERETLKRLQKTVDKKGESLKGEIFKISGKEFNLNSPKQLAAILFLHLGIPPLKKTKTGYSTNEEVLDKLSSQYPIAGLVLEYRHLNKLKTTYIVPLIEGVENNEGVLRAQFNQTGTQTGRLSSSSPNLQSIPVKGEFSQGLRKAFVPSRGGGCIFSGDYSQIELRILASLSGDENLIQAFKQNLDIHNFTAALLFGVEIEKVSDSQRNMAKKVNFGIVYGMSSFGLSRELKISPTEAQNFINDYFRRYPKIKEYIDRTYVQAEKKGFVTTILGRRRKLPDINSSNIQLKEFARRQAINAPIQGSCADLIKVAMVKIDKELTERKLKTKLIMQIHDELVFDVAPGELEEVKVFIKKYMEEAIKLIVQVKVNLEAGKNWGQMKEIE